MYFSSFKTHYFINLKKEKKGKMVISVFCSFSFVRKKHSVCFNSSIKQSTTVTDSYKRSFFFEQSHNIDLYPSDLDRLFGFFLPEIQLSYKDNFFLKDQKKKEI